MGHYCRLDKREVFFILKRTDNGVKNHFFAKLRKAMRRINKLIKDRFKKKLKEVKINVLYKIVEAN